MIASNNCEADGSKSCFRSLLLASAVCVLLSWCMAADDVPMPQRKGFRDTELHFFLHDDLLTANPSAVAVVPPVAGFNGTLEGQSFFGSVVVFDDSMTQGPGRDSLELGRGRGMYVFDSLDDTSPAIEFVWTAVFNDASSYGGSTLSFQGHDAIVEPVREIAITGGTGQFRLAEGYCDITTYELVGAAANLEFTCVVRSIG